MIKRYFRAVDLLVRKRAVDAMMAFQPDYSGAGDHGRSGAPRCTGNHPGVDRAPHAGRSPRRAGAGAGGEGDGLCPQPPVLLVPRPGASSFAT